jgi:hypothetical protein
MWGFAEIQLVAAPCTGLFAAFAAAIARRLSHSFRRQINTQAAQLP